MAWVTDSPHWLNLRSTSLSYRMLSSMQGSLGIGANITKWNDEEMATAKRLIAAITRCSRRSCRATCTG